MKLTKSQIAAHHKAEADWRDVSPNVEIALYDLDESAENWPETDPKDDA